jgi:hypothetical protein
MMNFERIWNEAVVTLSRYYPIIFKKGLRKPTKCLSQDSRCPGQDSNREPPESNSKALLLNPVH